MDQVYKNANTVFAWLGEADEYTVAGFAAVEKLAALAREITEIMSPIDCARCRIMVSMNGIGHRWLLSSAELGF
jgi:hypothetical protein